MKGPFTDKCCTFIGKLQSCSREEACDRLMAAGGVPHPRVNYITNYVILGLGAEHTKQYKTALSLEATGCLSILTEDRFFSALESGAPLPVNPNAARDVKVIPAETPEQNDTFLRDKRLGYLATKRVQTPEGEARIDLRPLYRANDVMKQLTEDNKD